MELGNMTIGSKEVQKVTLGSITVWEKGSSGGGGDTPTGTSDMSAVNIAARYSTNWYFGTVTEGKADLGYGEVGVNSMAIISTTPITQSYYGHITYTYQYGPVTGGGSVYGPYTRSNYTYSIPANATFTCSGVTYNGVKIETTTMPNLKINSCSSFYVD